MTKSEYLKAIQKLGLTPSGKATAAALGLSVRQVQRFASGETAIPETIANLLKALIELKR